MTVAHATTFATITTTIIIHARLENGGPRVNTLKWFVNEYRHEDETGQYYLRNIVKIWLSGLRYGFCAGFIPVLVWWILK